LFAVIAVEIALKMILDRYEKHLRKLISFAPARHHEGA
jgi:hypothetical protein